MLNSLTLAAVAIEFVAYPHMIAIYGALDWSICMAARGAIYGRILRLAIFFPARSKPTTLSVYHSYLRSKMKVLVRDIGLGSSAFSAHGVRAGVATEDLFVLRISCDIIKKMGRRESDCSCCITAMTRMSIVRHLRPSPP